MSTADVGHCIQSGCQSAQSCGKRRPIGKETSSCLSSRKHWTTRREVRMQVCRSQCNLPGFNGEKLMCTGVPRRLWREHSPGALLYWLSPVQQELAGHWRMVAGSITGLRAHNTKTKLLREGRLNELGEVDLEEDLMAHGFTAELVREQASRLSKARELVRERRGEGRRRTLGRRSGNGRK